MTQCDDYRAGKPLAIASLVVGATVWGLIWYPYRKLEAGGLSGITAIVPTYAVAPIVAIPVFWKQRCGARVDGSLIVVASLYSARDDAAGCRWGSAAHVRLRREGGQFD